MILTRSGREIKLTDEQFKNLMKSVNPRVSEDDQRKALAKIGITFTEKEANRIYDMTFNIKLNQLETIAAQQGADFAGFSEGAKIAVIDLYYNGGTRLVFGFKDDAKTSPFNITKYIKEEDEGRILGEILYNSNIDGNTGLDKRNVLRAKIILKEAKGEKRKMILENLEAWRKENLKQTKKAEERFKNHTLEGRVTAEKIENHEFLKDLVKEAGGEYTQEDLEGETLPPKAPTQEDKNKAAEELAKGLGLKPKEKGNSNEYKKDQLFNTYAKTQHADASHSGDQCVDVRGHIRDGYPVRPYRRCFSLINIG